MYFTSRALHGVCGRFLRGACVAPTDAVAAACHPVDSGVRLNHAADVDIRCASGNLVGRLRRAGRRGGDGPISHRSLGIIEVFRGAFNKKLGISLDHRLVSEGTPARGCLGPLAVPRHCRYLWPALPCPRTVLPAAGAPSSPLPWWRSRPCGDTPWRMPGVGRE
jgi:hypothetical protein